MGRFCVGVFVTLLCLLPWGVAPSEAVFVTSRIAPFVVFPCLCLCLCLRLLRVRASSLALWSFYGVRDVLFGFFSPRVDSFNASSRRRVQGCYQFCSGGFGANRRMLWWSLDGILSLPSPHGVPWWSGLLPASLNAMTSAGSICDGNRTVLPAAHALFFSG